MKREEKSQKMRRKIMDSALAEFSDQGYGVSSINTICAAENISKGIVYHYFETKDDLYLACVEECFQQLTDYIRSNFLKEDCSIEKHLRNYFSLRTHFFREHPVYQRIFCEAVIAPPAHLKAEIQRRKQDFINVRYQMTDLNPHTFEVREENCMRALNVLLYGVIQRKDGCQNEK